MDEAMKALVQEAVSGEVFGVWFLIGAALVFWMQAGFAMVEAGFTRAKNTGNIIMKNLMDFCIGSVVFVTLGSGLMLAEDYIAGVIGMPNLDIFTNWETYNWSGFVFNLVFCATAATIVSGAMAERTKFSAYCIYSAVISAVVYPIEAGWVWNSQGWLAQLGFVDYAGSAAIHMVGGTAALIGAIFLGPRIGKYVTDKNGKKEARAIPGHSLTIGALGVFILWFGWYGFNGAAATSLGQLGSIFVTTTISPAIATVVCMVFTWLKYGKPDVSMSLNASLAGLVGITAGCDVMNAAGAVAVGIVSGFLVPFGVWLLDHKLHIDDPVGAVAVHMMNGIWGTLAVGLFATTTVPGNDSLNGLFYGGGAELPGKQCTGIGAVAAWTAVAITITFLAIKYTIGLRASKEEEIIGLDATEHNLPSSYADFMPVPEKHSGITVSTSKRLPVSKTVTVTDVSAKTSDGSPKLTKLSIILKPEKLEALQNAFNEIGVRGITITNVMGYGTQMGQKTYYRGVEREDIQLRPKVKAEVVVSKVPVDDVINAAKKALYTGNIGDGKIFIFDVENAVKIRTGEVGYDALQGEEDN